ncbi:hypothetical protein SBI67_16755 [Mycolicibacterium sp. 120266]|jgi:hypothetical protein|uniref:DUF6841 family protein n=1 Tax=Mycolicibacterium sp. 120266 TaxID=3090601 RepID=UPI00299D62C2|nr:hypothetical protein [Mycolicibacterium sp. 120266]MDX1873771.1 hypothetical protein [Mycolicibacterium sp. 120266]
MALDSVAVRRWFDDYLEVFATAVRGERELSELLHRYAVPLLITTDDGVVTLTTADQVAGVIQGQVDGLRAQRYQHSSLLNGEVIVLNASSALYRGAFVRHDIDGAELGRVAVTYLVADGSDGVQIAVLASHGD